MYNVELVRRLCADIAAEKDAEKARELLHLLQAVVREDGEEARTRIAFLRQQYATAISETDSAD